MLSEQLNLFGDRPQSPKPPARVRETVTVVEEGTAPTENKRIAVLLPEAEENDKSPIASEAIPAATDVNELSLPIEIESGETEALPIASEAIPAAADEVEIPPSVEVTAEEESAAVVDDVPENDEIIFAASGSNSIEDASVADKAESTHVDNEDFEDDSMPVGEVVGTGGTVEDKKAAGEDAEANETPSTALEQDDAGWSRGELNIPPDKELFQRQYYTMRETTAMFGMTHAQLRNWENEFDILQPRKNRKGDRYFRPVDIKNLEMIYHLIRKRKFTPDGAKEYLKNNKKALDNFAIVQKLEGLKTFLTELKANL